MEFTVLSFNIDGGKVSDKHIIAKNFSEYIERYFNNNTIIFISLSFVVNLFAIFYFIPVALLLFAAFLCQFYSNSYILDAGVPFCLSGLFGYVFMTSLIY